MKPPRLGVSQGIELPCYPSKGSQYQVGVYPELFARFRVVGPMMHPWRFCLPL